MAEVENLTSWERGEGIVNPDDTGEGEGSYGDDTGDTPGDGEGSLSTAERGNEVATGDDTGDQNEVSYD